MLVVVVLVVVMVELEHVVEVVVVVVAPPPWPGCWLARGQVTWRHTAAWGRGRGTRCSRIRYTPHPAHCTLHTVLSLNFYPPTL